MGKTAIAILVRTGACLLWCSFPIPAQPGPAYVGSGVCARCHKKLYDGYTLTAMGRSMSRAASHLEKALIPVTMFNPKLDRYFAVFRSGSSLYQSEYALDPAGKEVFRSRHKLEYAVGSGANGYSFIVRRGDYLFQAPLSFYSKTQKWELSPGYEFADHGFSRPIAPACVACHSGRPQPAPGRIGMYRDPPFQELAVGCENCHGPGQSHAAHPSKATIVNPGKLPSRLAEDVCMNCHQGGDTRVLQPGKEYGDFRPGAPLIETLAIFRIPRKREVPPESDLLEHHSAMRLSRCYRDSGERLTCLTCHDPHVMPSRAEAAGFYRARCLACHTGASCTLPERERLRRANDCVGCHMLKREVAVISHSSLTNHRIVSRPGQPYPDGAFDETTPELPDLVLVNRSPHSKNTIPPLTLLRAYGELMEKEPSYLRQYLNLLEQLSQGTPQDPLVLAALGRKILRESSEPSGKALEYLARAVESGSTSPTSFEDLAEALARAGRLEEAVGVLEQGITLAPYTAVLYKSLALRYINLKQYSRAKETMIRYLEIFPEDAFMRGLLDKAAPPAPSR